MEFQLWVKNAEGKVWGPLPARQIELLIERRLITGVTEASRDGRRYAPAGQEPALAEALGKMQTAAGLRRTTSGAHDVWRPKSDASSAAGAPPVIEPPKTSVPPSTAPVLTPARTKSGSVPTAGAGVVRSSPSKSTVLTPPPMAAAAVAPATTAVAFTAPPPPPAPAKIIQAAPPEGRLEEHSPFKLYYLIAAAEAGGRLVMGEGKEQFSVWFKGGTPHAVEAVGLGLGEYLIEQRVLKPEQLASAKTQIAQTGGDIASGLFAAGLLNPQTAFPLIQQHAQTVLQRGLLLEAGPFTFDPAAPVPPSGFQLGQRWQLLSASARKIDPLRLRRWMQGREGLVAELAGSTAELQLTAQEARLLANLDGVRSLSELVSLAGPHADMMERLLILLHEIDRVIFTGAVASSSASTAPPPAAVAKAVPPAVRPVVAASVAPAPVAPPPAASSTGGLAGAIAKAMADNAASKAPAPTPAGGPPVLAPPRISPTAAKPAAAPAPVAKPAAPAPRPAAKAAAPAAGMAPMKIGPGQGANSNMPALVKLVEELKTKDFYARLKLERVKAMPPMLKANYFQLAKLYHPDTVPPDGPEEARRIKADILALMNEAHGVLADDAKREEYFEELEAKDAVGDLDVEAILAAEEDFQHAIVLAKARKFADALAIIEKCIKTNAKEGEFYAWRGYCRFFGSQDKRTFKDMAIADQDKALQLSPKCFVAWLFKGQIWKILEDIPKAKDAFKKTLDMDPNNVEAQRELRLFEQRKK